MKKNKNKAKIIELLKAFETATSLGFTISFPVVLGAMSGAIIDIKTNFKPFFTLVFLVIGTLISFYNMYKILKDTLKNNVK